MEQARRIATDAELQSIAGTGYGYVADPFNRWWHSASCPRILGMTAGEAKWFAPTRKALDAYLDRRLAQYPTAKPILPCGSCAAVSTGSVLGISKRPARTAAAAISQSHVRPPEVERTEGRFDIWADECIRNQSKASSSAGELRRLIAGELRAFPEPEGRILHAAYAGERSSGTDVENLLFNNIDQTLGLFRRASRSGIRFEDVGLAVPAAPSGTPRRSFYSYRLTAEDTPFDRVHVGESICSVPEVVVPEGPGRLSARCLARGKPGSPARRRVRPPRVWRVRSATSGSRAPPGNDGKGAYRRSDCGDAVG